MRAWFLLFALAGCMKNSDKYCQLHGADDPDYCHYGGPDAPGAACETGADCSAPLPACAPDTHTCVECIDDDACAASTAGPVCLPAHTCGKCSAHSDCASDACLPSGACAAEGEVAYVSDQNAGGNACTRQMPCATIDEGAKRQRPYIKVSGAILDTKLTSLDTSVTILADPGAKMGRTGDGAILEIKADAEVTIYDLEIGGATGPGAAGIAMTSGTPKLTLERVLLAHNRGFGISTSIGSVTMHRSIVTDNRQGGVAMQGTDYVLTNNLFVQNGESAGATGSQTGGLTLSTGPTTNVFEFNTVADNSSMASTVGARGINCTLPMTIANNLLINNRVGSQCTVTHSMFETGFPVTGSNSAGDPMFASIDGTNPRAGNFYRIGSASDAKNAADPAATIADDIDGDSRPQEGARDIGADEFKP